MSLLIFYAAISIFFSFLCSILEAVLLSITPTFVNIKKQEGKSYALKLEELKKDVDKPLIAILTINTIAHTVGAILVGVQAETLEYKINIFGINTVGIISALMTLLILVVSEIIPKTIGAKYWKKLAGFTANALLPLILILKYTGILWLLQLTTKLIGGSGGHGSILSREDFHAMTDIAHEEGVFEKNESAIIKNLLTFKQVQVKDVMTPRTVMIRASENTTVQEFFEEHPKLRFSRIPIYKKNSDNITGFILKDEVMEEIINGNRQKKLSEIKRELLITNRTIPIPSLFEKFISQKEHIALVVDEYGTTSGIVTMEDVIETLLGLEIMDESDNVEDLQLLARKSWETRAKKIGLIDDRHKKDNL
ncbi:CNNM domain-containing protein [Lutibacter maritimus]|uniref:Hemolysin, contains CBS domains n=1 Tax=Lutibacter maritimus TaxID=593133 RepID=A0A1I6PEM7_9FLAO|nr:hemolysin family protein [Lutibacter maritimus]SFS38664.1 Hemolysin, contains CBS domains [Lutibacter maritimus]